MIPLLIASLILATILPIVTKVKLRRIAKETILGAGSKAREEEFILSDASFSSGKGWRGVVSLSLPTRISK